MGRLEVAIRRSGHAPGVGIAAQEAFRPRISERPPVEIPILVAGACLVVLIAVVLAKSHPARVIGRDLHDARVRNGKGRVRRRRVPVGNLGLCPQPLDVVIGAIVQRTVDLGKRAGMARAFDEVVPGLIAEAAGPRFGKTSKILTARRVDVGSPGLGRANCKGAGVAQARPPHALTALEPRHQQVVAVSGCQFLAAQPFRRNNGLGIAEFSTPDRADVSHRLHWQCGHTRPKFQNH